MTTRKSRSRVPKGAKLSAEDNQWFETVALTDLENLPTRAWEDMAALWRYLPWAHPSTRRRILARCIELVRERGDTLSVKFVNCFAVPAIRELAVSKTARARVGNDEGLRAAARYLAHRPDASWSELAVAAAAKRGTVRQWKGRQDFQKYLDDEKFLAALERARQQRRRRPVRRKMF
jgi:hypothetical protein